MHSRKSRSTTRAITKTFSSFCSFLNKLKNGLRKSTRGNVTNDLMVDEEDESVPYYNRHLLKKTVASSSNPQSSLMLTSSNINCVGGGGAVGNANSRSLPRRCKEPYPIDVVSCCPDGNQSLYGNFRSNNKRSVCHEDVPLTGSNSKQTSFASSVGESYELSVDIQQKQFEILTRKYGGQFRARRAAVIIQKAYRKYSMKKKFEKLRKRSSVGAPATSSNSNRLFVSNIEIDTNDTNNYKSKVSWNGYRIAPSDRLMMTPDGVNGAKSFNDATREKFYNTSSSSSNGVADDAVGRIHPSSKLNRKVDDNRTDISSSSSPIIAVITKESNCRTTSSSCGQQQFPTTNVVAEHQSTPFRSHNKQRTGPVERNQYTATTNLNLTPPIEINTFKVATTTTTATTNVVVDECKLFNNNNNSTNIVLSSSAEASPSTSNVDTQYVSYVRIGCSNRKEFGQFVDPLPSSSDASALRSGAPTDGVEQATPGRTPSRFSPSCTTDDDNNRKAVVVDQFYSPIKLQEKSKASSSSSHVVHLTKSVDSVKDLCTASSSSVTHSTRQEEDFRSVNPKASTPLSPMSPIWVPRTNSPIKVPVADNLNDDHHLICRSSSQNTNGARNCSKNIPTVESRLLHHWAWGRPALYRASIRRNDLERRRQYRIALNFFNKKPERGVEFLICWNFVEGTPMSVAKFLVSRKGISKQMIGEYLGNLQNPFNMAVLDCFVNELDMRGMEMDVALRKFLSLFRLPGEAQKIERIVEVFARRYCQCNQQVVKLFKQADTIFVLAFAIIMLNTDLHSPSIKSERRMKLEDFIKNLRGIDAGSDINQKFLTELYRRVKDEQFKPGTDHVGQVIKVDRNVVGKKPTLALPHRRLVCYCRLYEVADPTKKQSPTAHQREIFLFNDMMMVTKILSRKKNVITYSFRQNHCLVGMQIQSFRNQHYANGLQINHTLENKTLYFNARNADDRAKFIDDLREAILESDEMEALRIELELEKQNGISRTYNNFGRVEQQRDSGLADMEQDPAQFTVESARLPKNPISNSLLDLADPHNGATVNDDVMQRHPSGTSLDSGMSSASIGSRESSPRISRPSTSTTMEDQTPTSPTTKECPKSNNNRTGGFNFFGKKSSKQNDHRDFQET